VDVRFVEAAIAGLPVDEVEVDLGLLNGRVEVNALRVSAPAGDAVVTGSLGEEADLRLQAAALTLAAAPFADLVPGSLRGTLDLEARLTGDLERPTVIASLGGRDLALGDAPLGGDGTARLDLEWRDGEVRLDGTLLGLLEVAGGGEADMERFDLRADLATDQIESLIHLAAGSVYPELGGALRGELAASGNWDGSDVRAALTGEHLAVSWTGTELRLLEPYLITLVEDRLRVESLYLGDESGSSELFLFGDLPLTADQSFDLRIQAALSSVWAQPFFPDWEIGEGRFEGLGAIRGAADELRMSGQGELTQSSLLIPGVPGSFRDIAGYVLFDPGRIVLDSFHAGFAGGTLRAEGTVALPGGEAPTLQYQLQASARGVTVRYPPGFVLRGGAEASIVSTAEGRRISGVVELDRAFYLEDVPIGFSQLLQTVFDKQPLDIRETDELLASTELNLLVRGPDALAVRNNVADLDGDIDLAVRGTLARPVVFGAVEVKAGGKLVYSGNEYTVERAVLTFANPFRIEPIIDLVATTELREYDVTLTLAGTLDQLTATVVSDPPLADLDVLALLTAGGDLPGAYDGSSSTASPSEQGVAAGLLYGQAASAVARRFNRLFGLDQFRIDPLTEASGGLESARVTVGQRLSSDLFATYSYDPSRTDIQVLELEWQLNRAVTVIATQNGDGTYALDVRWQKSF
jgi:translocation and assembly module TamB